MKPMEETSHSEETSNVRRTHVIHMRKQELFAALEDLYNKSKKLSPPKYGWAEFRDWIDKTRIILQHGFGVNSDQEREFMQIEYAPGVNGWTVLNGSPFQSVDSLAWYTEGITKAQQRLTSIMDEAVHFCSEMLEDTPKPVVGLDSRPSTNPTRKLTIMVSSAVYGYQEFLDRIYDLLVALGYEVWMSHKGTIPVMSDCDTLENCIHGVEKCDLFLGIITGQYGKTIRNGLSATHLEFKKAIELNKPRWFIIDDRVIFARRFLNGLFRDEELKTRIRRDEVYFKGDAAFSDLRLIDMYELARERKPDGDDVKWVQEFRDDNSALLFAMAQFGRYLEIEELLKNRLSNMDDIRARIARKGV